MHILTIMTSQSAGSINERGYINGMNKKGFNLSRCVSELTANSLDAKAKNVTWDVTRDFIKIIDDGRGMTNAELINMWDCQRENHSEQITTGVSGFGSKPSTKLASKNTEVIMYTKSKDDLYYKAVIPWNEIVSQGKYVDMINISECNQEEIIMFQKDISDTGTIIQFNHNYDLENELNKQFHYPKDIPEMNLRLDCVFGSFSNTNFKLVHYEKPEKDLLLYNYFHKEPNMYYTDKLDNYLIEIHKDPSGKIVYLRPIPYGGYEYITKCGNGHRLKNYCNSHSSQKFGELNISCGLLKDDNYFNFKNPELPTATKKISSYESAFFDGTNEELKTDIWYPSLERNSQYIGNINPLPRFKPTSARGDGKNCLKLSRLRTKVSYEVNSSQENIIDELIGIQENKNQLNSSTIDEGLKRMIEECIKDTTEKIWSNFEGLIQKFNNEKKLKLDNSEKLYNQLLSDQVSWCDLTDQQIEELKICKPLITNIIWDRELEKNNHNTSSDDEIDDESDDEIDDESEDEIDRESEGEKEEEMNDEICVEPDSESDSKPDTETEFKSDNEADYKSDNEADSKSDNETYSESTKDDDNTIYLESINIKQTELPEYILNLLSKLTEEQILQIKKSLNVN